MNKFQDISQQKIGEFNNSDLKQATTSNQAAPKFWTIGNVKEDANKWKSFDASTKPMKDFWMMTDNILQVYAIQFALKFEIFEKLNELKDWTSAKNLISALKLGLPERRFEDLLDQLFVHGFLERKGVLESAQYKISDYTAQYLLKASPESHYYTYLQHHELLKDLMDAEKAIQTGKFKDSYAELLKSEEMMRIVACYQCRANKSNWEIMLDEIDFNQFKRVVNIAGQAGYLAKAFAKKYPNIEFVNFDAKEWKKIQDETAKKCGAFESNIKFEYGNPLDKIPEGDCILLPNIITWMSCENRMKLAENLFKALKSGGKIVILENVTSENRDRDDCGLKQSFITLIAGTEGFGESLKEHEACLKKVGFTNVEQIAKGKGNVDIITANRA